MKIEISEDIESLMGDPAVWNSLSGGVPFRQTQWLSAWWRNVGCRIEKGNVSPAIIVARDDANELCAMLPLYRCGGGRKLRAMGDGNACTDYLSVLCESSRSVQLSTAVGRYLGHIAADKVIGWDLIDFEGAVQGDEAIGGLVEGLRDAGCNVHAESRMSTWRRPRDVDWETHLSRHSKTQRRRMRRWSEKFDTIEGLERKIATTESEVALLTDEIIELHQRRWIDSGEAGTYADSNFRQFIHDAVLGFHRTDNLHLASMSLHGRTIAGEINLIGDNRIMYSYSAGYDTDHKEIEPGRIVFVDGLREMYRRDLVAVDFMRGDELYKQRFSTESKRLYTLRAFAPELLPRMRYAGYRTAFEMKQWMRKQTGRPLLEVAGWS